MQNYHTVLQACICCIIVFISIGHLLILKFHWLTKIQLYLGRIEGIWHGNERKWCVFPCCHSDPILSSPSIMGFCPLLDSLLPAVNKGIEDVWRMMKKCNTLPFREVSQTPLPAFYWSELSHMTSLYYKDRRKLVQFFLKEEEKGGFMSFWLPNIFLFQLLLLVKYPKPLSKGVITKSHLQLIHQNPRSPSNITYCLFSLVLVSSLFLPFVFNSFFVFSVATDPDKF